MTKLVSTSANRQVAAILVAILVIVHREKKILLALLKQDCKIN